MEEEQESYYRENIECPECGSSEGVGVYQREDGSYYGNCFNEACGKYINDPYGEGGSPSMDEFSVVKKEGFSMSDADEASINELTTRGISREACEKYDVLSVIDDGYDAIHYYPHTKNGSLSSYMRRVVTTKKFKSSGDTKGLEFFGQSKCGNGGKMIIVTEGQLDTLAAFDMLKKCDKNYRVISLVNGSSSAVKCFKTNFEWINKFESIFLAFDQDEPGQIAAEKVGDIFEPNRVKNMQFSEKDANDLSANGKHREFLNAIFNAKEARPEGIVSIEDVYEDAMKPPEVGLSFPWPSLTDATYGYRRGELHGVTGATASGKTEWFKEVVSHIMQEHGLPCGLFFLEEEVSRTAKIIAGKKLNRRFHIPTEDEKDWTFDELREGLDSLKGKLYLYQHFGSKDWKSIESKIRYMHASLGVSDFFVDNLTCLVAEESDEYKALNIIMSQMSALTQDLGITIFYISHLKKATGTAHSEGGRISIEDMRGSSSIGFWSNFVYAVERDQTNEDEDIRNTAKMVVLKDRNIGSATGFTFNLKYDHKTGKWDEFDDTDTFDEDDFA